MHNNAFTVTCILTHVHIHVYILVCSYVCCIDKYLWPDLPKGALCTYMCTISRNRFYHQLMAMYVHTYIHTAVYSLDMCIIANFIGLLFLWLLSESMPDVHECSGGFSFALLAVDENLPGYKAYTLLANDACHYCDSPSPPISNPI